MMRIQLTQGRHALVDEDDRSLAAERKWYAWSPGKGLWYVRSTTDRVLMHRFFMNPGKGMVVDHINGDGLDCRRSNMRVCTHRQNIRNSAPQSRGSSRFKGVHWEKRLDKWVSKICVDYRTKHIGCFAVEEDAARAYDRAAGVHFGEFARLNFEGPRVG